MSRGDGEVVTKISEKKSKVWSLDSLVENLQKGFWQIIHIEQSSYQ